MTTQTTSQPVAERAAAYGTLTAAVKAHDWEAASYIAGQAQAHVPDYTRPQLGRDRCATCGQVVTLELGETQPQCISHGHCDECEHTMAAHVSLHDIEDAGGEARWGTATCWASSTCIDCGLVATLGAASRLLQASAGKLDTAGLQARLGALAEAEDATGMARHDHLTFALAGLQREPPGWVKIGVDTHSHVGYILAMERTTTTQRPATTHTCSARLYNGLTCRRPATYLMRPEPEAEYRVPLPPARCHHHGRHRRRGRPRRRLREPPLHPGPRPRRPARGRHRPGLGAGPLTPRPRAARQGPPTTLEARHDRHPPPVPRHLHPGPHARLRRPRGGRQGRLRQPGRRPSTSAW